LSKKHGSRAKARVQGKTSAPAQPPPSGLPGGHPLRKWLVVGAAVVLVAIAIAAYFTVRGPGSSARAIDADSGAAGEARRRVANYVGGAACASCHDKEHAAWRGSHHDLAMQVASDKSVLGDFAGAKFRYAGVTSTFLQRDGKFFVNTDGPDGKLADFEVQYTFGVLPLQQYLIELSGGRLQALGIAWDSRPKEAGGQRWFHLYPDSSLKAGDPQHWTGIDQNWNFQCADCHSTNLRKNFDARQNRFDTKWSEIDVSCEACHGPGSDHLAWAKKEDGWQRFDGPGKGLAAALDERRAVTWNMDNATGNAARSAPRAGAREIEVCARCHARRGQLTDDIVHGRPFGDGYRLALLEDGLYWNDGQQREEVYEIGSFLQSKMFAKGVTCADCHNPHSLKLRSPGSAVCSQCHLPARYSTPEHTHHPQDSKGADCAACHMPTKNYMIVDARRDHSMRIPRPDLSVTLGVPNACNNCHTGQTPQWAAAVMVKWFGKPPVGYQRFAEAFGAESKGAPSARGALLALIQDKDQPAIVRASAIERFGRWLTPSTLNVMVQGLNDPDPLVRAAAVGTLADIDPAVRRQYLPRMLDDPVRAVRIDAARALAGVPETDLPASTRASFVKAMQEYVAVQTYLADRPESHTNLGNMYAEGGETERAVAEYRNAIEIDPTFEVAYANLADLYRARGDEAQAGAVLREGLARNPKAAELEYALGLSFVRQKDSAASLQALREATRLAPDDPRFAYVYAVALNDSGHAREALKVLDGALKRSPYNPDVLTALTYYNAAVGNRDAALGYVRRLRELDPDNRAYAQLAEKIEALGHP
jgi:Flp pilus assembly protein TadD